MTLKPKKLTGTSQNPQEELLALFKEKCPEIFTDGKVDCVKLKATLGEEFETGKERYGLTWTGKSKCFRTIQEPTTATLVPVREESVEFDTTKNVFIEGDNLEALKVLQKAYYGSVKMIYIDPPYNTGNDFIYNDDFRTSKAEYREDAEEVDPEGNSNGDSIMMKNTQDSGHYHSRWLNMMYPRLFLARQLLRKDGVIFISIDEHEVNNIGVVLNEIFGADNCVGCLAIVNNMKGRNDKKNIATSHEYLYVYTRSDFDSYGLPLNEEQLKQYKNIDENNERYALRDLRKRGRPDRREDRPNMYFPIFYNQFKNSFSLERISEEDVEITPKKGDGSDGRWRWGKERVKNNLNILEAKYSKSKNRWDLEHRVYLNEPSEVDYDDDEEADDDDLLFERTSKSKSFWWGGEISTDVGRREFKKLFSDADFDYPKSPYYIKKMLHMATKGNDIILDFFAGSSPTAQATMMLNAEDGGNRQCISVQLPEECAEDSEAAKAGFKTIADIAKERIRRAGKKIKEESGKDIDIGFKAFKLQDSNFKIWRSNVTDADELKKQMELFIDNVKKDSVQENILYELMLKTGLDLNTPTEKEETKEGTYFRLKPSEENGTVIIICLEEKLSEKLAEQMTKEKPTKFICLDRAFGGNDQLKTNVLLQMEQAGVDFSVI